MISLKIILWISDPDQPVDTNIEDYRGRMIILGIIIIFMIYGVTIGTIQQNRDRKNKKDKND